MNILDLSHYIYDGMMVYPGDPEVSVSEGLVHSRDYCHVDRLHLNSHTGTHIDAPFHFLADGKTITDYEASRFVMKGRALDMRDKGEDEPISVRELSAFDIRPGTAAVMVTGWYKYFGTERYLHHPCLSKEGAQYLVDKGVSLVAVDFLNVDSTSKEEWDAHPILLGNDVLIVENLANTAELDFEKEYLFSFLPLKVRGTDGSPIRAVAIEI